MENKPKYWKQGMKQQLAEEAGITPAYLSTIIHGQNVPSVSVAQRLEDATKRLGFFVSQFDWLNVSTSNHPAFNTN